MEPKATARIPKVLTEHRDGFSLIELLVALAVFGIAITVIFGVLNNMSSSFTEQEVKVQAQQLLRAGSDIMIQDIRIAGYDPTGEADNSTNIKPGITAATSQRLQFTADINGNRVIDDVDTSDGIDSDDFERMTYEYDGASRVEQVLVQADGTEINRTLLVDDITVFSFTYLDENNADLGSPVAAGNLDAIRTVVLNMTIEKSAGRREAVDRTITTNIKCRNLGLE